MTDSPGEYEALIRGLPPPSLAQTERFALYVSRAHSWYKHLRLHPKTPFVFFLDPSAGRETVYTSGGNVELVDITDESRRFHYTWMPTQEYRRRFGYWNYHAPTGTSFMYAGHGGVVTTKGRGLEVPTESGEWTTVPDDFIAVGTALISSAIYGSASVLYGDVRTPSTRHSLSDLLRLFREECEGLPLREQLPPAAVAALSGVSPRSLGYDWPDEPWLNGLAAAGVELAAVSKAVKCVDQERTRRMISPRGNDYDEVYAFIPEARARQLLAMTDAMNRVVASLYSSPRAH